MWTEYRTPDNVPYWHNPSTGISLWQRPPDPAEGGGSTCPPMPRPPLAPLPHRGVGAPATLSSAPPPPAPPPFAPLVSRPGTPTVYLPSNPPPFFPPPLGQPQPLHMPPARLPPQERPVVMKPVPASQWFVVLTSFGGEFYFNPTKSKALWEPPQALLNALEDWKSSAPVSAGAKRSLDSESGGPDGKRPKAAETEGTELTEEDIAFQLQCMEEESEFPEELTGEQEAADANDPSANQRNELPPREERKASALDDPSKMTQEEKNQAFLQIFRDLDVSPFALWQKELPRIIHDRRYTLIPTLKERKALFDEYCQMRAIELRREKEMKQKDALSDYRTLMKEFLSGFTGLRHPRFDEFYRKHKRDPRFTEFSDLREREKVFKDYLKEKKYMQNGRNPGSNRRK